MTLYCIGDIQGCDEALERLLSHIGFSPSRDTAYLLGDLVNRGPDSLAVLRRCFALEGALRPLLGNHDLHLLASAQGIRPLGRRDTLEAILQAPDRHKLLHWLRCQPLAYRHEYVGESLFMVHAGLLPHWTTHDALGYAAEVQDALRSAQWVDFLQSMYGNKPTRWHDDLQGAARLRVITNALTRLRFCAPDGAIDCACTDHPDDAPAGLLPWFDVPHRRSAGSLIAFGHWSTLGWMNRPDLLALDTGCVWGGHLSAVGFGATLADRTLYQVACPAAQTPGD